MEQLQHDDSHVGPVLKAKIDDKKPALDSIQAPNGTLNISSRFENNCLSNETVFTGCINIQPLKMNIGN